MQQPALKPGYSTLLIHDHIAPEDGAVHPHTTAYDLTMMAMVAGKERSENDWRNLVAKAGLEVVQIWRSEKAVQGIIECRVPEKDVWYLERKTVRGAGERF